MKLTLWGAYHRLVRPLEQRSLALHVSFDRTTLHAALDAEDLVAGAPVRVAARRSGFAVEYRMSFSDREGAACALELVQRLDDWTLRGWTELAGTLDREETGPWGRARLRLDYRDVALKELRLAAWRTIIVH